MGLTTAGSAQQAPGPLVGYVRTADFVTAEGATVHLRGSLQVGRVEADGGFSISNVARGGATGEVQIDLDGYFSAVVPAPASGKVGTVILIPRRWRIATGAHAGTMVDVDLPGAVGLDCPTCDSFYGSVMGTEESRLPPGIPTWPPRAFPLEVAFDRENGGSVTAADSAAFWRVARSIEERFGLRLFRAAPLSRVLANKEDDGPGSLLVMIDPRLPNIGWGSYGAQSGDILAGAVHFRSAYTFRSSTSGEVVAHEVFHALGFGHTCAWRSIVADVRRCRGMQAPLPTASDVAHAQLLWRIRQLEREARVWNTVEAAMRGEF